MTTTKAGIGKGGVCDQNNQLPDIPTSSYHFPTLTNYNHSVFSDPYQAVTIIISDTREMSAEAVFEVQMNWSNADFDDRPFSSRDRIPAGQQNTSALTMRMDQSTLLHLR